MENKKYGFSTRQIHVGKMKNSAGDTVCTARSEHVFLNREGHFVRMKREMPEFCAAIEASMD